jgi:RNA recognition motif. (a.k.a. RRM, RBD, or RNP domain)
MTRPSVPLHGRWESTSPRRRVVLRPQHTFVASEAPAWGLEWSGTWSLEGEVVVLRGAEGAAGPTGGFAFPMTLACDARFLYLGNLPLDARADALRDDLRALLPEAGVERLHLPLDADGLPRGFAFVTLASASAAALVAEGLAGVHVRGRALAVERFMTLIDAASTPPITYSRVVPRS